MKEETPFLPFLTISSKEYYNLLKVAKHAKAILPHCKEVTSQYAFGYEELEEELEDICDELEVDLQELEKGIAPSAYLNAKESRKRVA
tara:strand:+ start:1399 stop:1662 length:264 start_codon:yes stop_codon:yes gene_type:complete